MIADIIKLNWNICLFRQGPQDVPESVELFLLTLVGFVGMYLLQYLCSNMMTGIDLMTASMRIIGVLGSIVIFTYLVLVFRKVQSRYLQTLTAIIGTQSVLTIFIIPIMLLASLILYPEQNKFIIVLFSIIYFLGMVLLNIWHMLILAHIFRNALNMSLFSGILTSIALMVFTLLVIITTIGI